MPNVYGSIAAVPQKRIANHQKLARDGQVDADLRRHDGSKKNLGQ